MATVRGGRAHAERCGAATCMDLQGGVRPSGGPGTARETYPEAPEHLARLKCHVPGEASHGLSSC